eukprot:sb/3462940/
MQTHHTKLVRSNTSLSFTTLLPTDLPVQLVDVAVEQFLVEIQRPSPRVPFPICHDRQRFNVIPLTNGSGRDFKLQVSRNLRMKDGTTQTENRKRKKGFLHSEEVRQYVEELRVKYGLSKEDVDDILDNGPSRGTKTTTPSRNSRTAIVPVSNKEVFTDCPIATSTQNPPVAAGGNQNLGSKNSVDDEGEINLEAHPPSSHVSLESVLKRAGVKENLADLTCSSIEETPPESATSQQPPEEEPAKQREVGSPKEHEEVSPDVAIPVPLENEQQNENSQELLVGNQRQQNSENNENQEDSQDSILNLDMLADQVLMSLEDEEPEKVMISETQEKDLLSETQEENLLSESIDLTSDYPPKDSEPNHPGEDNPREKINVVMVLSQPENGELVIEKSPKLVIEKAPEKTPMPEIIDVFSQTQQDKSVIDVFSQQQDNVETNLQELIFIDSQDPSAAEVVVIGDSPTSPPGLKDDPRQRFDSQKSSEDIYATPETSPVATPETSPVVVFQTPEREEELDTSVHVLETVGLERTHMTPNNKQMRDDGDTVNGVREDGDTFVQGPVHVVCDDQIVTTQSLPSPERPLVPVTRSRKKNKNKVPYDMDLASRQLLAIPETRHGLRKRQGKENESNGVSARKKKRIRL